jgi:hypothetical protein
MSCFSKKEVKIMIMDFQTEESLIEVLCEVCIWKENGECSGEALCETCQYIESKT